MFSPGGQLLAKYDKIHLWPPAEEPKYLTAGEKAQVLDAPWGKSALPICYDLCFPGLFHEYAFSGPKVVFLQAEWPKTHLGLWRRLLRARAIENQCFIIGCNGLGESKGMSFGGHSATCGPWGELVVEGGQQEMTLTAEIDLGFVDDVRRRFPFLA